MPIKQSKLDFLPERGTDFIFTSFGEDFIGTTILIVVIIVIALFVFRLFLKRKSESGLEVKKSYFYLAMAVLIPIGLASGLLNFITRNVLASLWDEYPNIITLGPYTPDGFTIFLHQFSYVGIISVAILFVMAIGMFTFFIKPKYADTINATLFIFGVYVLVISLAWLMIPMIVLAKVYMLMVN